MPDPWPHAPPHYFTPQGTYMLTAGTNQKARLFDTPVKLDLLANAIFQLADAYALTLQAWAFLENHYHLVASFEKASVSHRSFVRHLHREIALRLNESDGTPGRRVMYEYWDTELTYEKSWPARLHYVHHNPVKHGIVEVATDYPWCSARWFETNARPAFVKSVYSFRIDRVNVREDY
jgi:putative transposase